MTEPKNQEDIWKAIQINTFKRWCNEYLRMVDKHIDDLETDLCDGVLLIDLLQVLSGNKIVDRYIKRPVEQHQKIQNVSIALNFMKEQNIRLVNIENVDIVNGEVPLILGLIWNLILKYSISLAFDENEDSKVKPKQALLTWVKNEIPAQVPMTNFKQDWNNGKAVGALVDAVAPGLYPDWEDNDPKNALENATEAMKLAEDWLGVPQVLAPADMVSPFTDDLSIMTYISGFMRAELKPGAPIPSSENINKQSGMMTSGPQEDPTAADAEWKKIQQNTFTRWCNEHLKVVNKYIYNLETDLCDGLLLIQLLQVLSHKKVGRYNKKPTFRPQKLENISIALRFIELENIRLVNIDASDILKGNLKLILGLIWTLILKYAISLEYEGEDEEDNKVTPKQALLRWVKSKVPSQVTMTNFTIDWNDGKAVGALVDAVAPGLYPGWVNNDPEDALRNASEAMKLAEDWLDVPQVLDPADMINPNVDELSIMTYISAFWRAKLKPGAPIRPRKNIDKVDDSV